MLDSLVECMVACSSVLLIGAYFIERQKAMI